MDIVGKTIGRYEITEALGEGGMARVYKAFDPGIARSAALKILKQEHCADPDHKERFLREGKAAGALTHPNIVTIYDVGELDGAPYILMELLEGESLADILASGRRLSIETLVRIGRQLAMALDYAHQRGIVHRDIKPDNILVQPDGETVKITDFGIARLQDHSGTRTTQVGMMLGTPRYMSPEQATGNPVDGRTDLFSTGVILYELITGQKAFDADSVGTLMMQIVQKDPVPIRQLNAKAPAGLQKIVNRLLQKKPERRYQSGAELQKALERELAQLRTQREESRGYLPMQIKWTAIMAIVVALGMALSTTLVFRAQSEALRNQAIDSGLALARFIAVQTAIPVLGEDWPTLDALVMDASARDTFNYLVISDHRNTVRSATNPQLVGSTWAPPDVEAILMDRTGATVTDRGGQYNFLVPITFNATQVGEVNLGVSTAALDRALDTTLRLLVALGFAIVLAVTLVLYLFNKLAAKNLRLATQALHLFRDGNTEARISRTRSDEFGDLFQAYNDMADSVEERLYAEQHDAGIPLVATDATATEISGISQSAVDDRTVVRPRVTRRAAAHDNPHGNPQPPRGTPADN